MKDKIIDLLSDGNIRSFSDISNELGLDVSRDQELAITLNNMVNDYDIYYSKKGNYSIFSNNKEYCKGSFISNSKGFGFVKIDNLEDAFIPKGKTMGSITGDKVLVKVDNWESATKFSGSVVKIISHDIKSKVGEVYYFNDSLFVKLDDKKITNRVKLIGGDGIVVGDKVLVSIVNDNKNDYLCGNFIKRIGNINDPDIDIISVLADNNFDVEFPNEVWEELKDFPNEVRDCDLSGRSDLRDKVIFTIDGDDTKDIDDALSIEKMDNGNYLLGVHIADVSYYVKEDSALDKEAFKRGTSVYLADRVVPMYPHQLSNGICSLNPNVDRLAVSCLMEINDRGERVSYDLFPSVIHSRIQMTYKKVNDYLEKGFVNSGYEDFTNDLTLLLDLTSKIRDNKNRRGCIDFDTDEMKIMVDKEGRAIDIIKRDRGVGERLIEDCMIMANECVAEHLFYMDVPSLYRVHDLPNEKRLRSFLSLLSSLGISVRDDFKSVKPRNIQTIVNELKNYKEFKVLSTMMLSCMDKAVYSPNNIGHFGIASKCYTHFTSPIRRYPDTTIHRLLHEYCFSSDGVTNDKIKHFGSIMSLIGDTSSERERASIECERVVDAMKSAEYMSAFVGKRFKGMISGITNFGFFVILDNLVEGLVPIMGLPGYFSYDKDRQILFSRNGMKFRIGDEVIVRVVRTSKEERTIDFEFERRVDVSEKKKNKKKC